MLSNIKITPLVTEFSSADEQTDTHAARRPHCPLHTSWQPQTVADICSSRVATVQPHYSPSWRRIHKCICQFSFLTRP